MRYYQQFDESDCGAACLAMIAYYKKVQTASVQMDKYPYEYTSPLYNKLQKAIKKNV